MRPRMRDHSTFAATWVGLLGHLLLGSLGLALLLLGGCARDTETDSVNLIERFPLSTLEVGTRAIDFGNPAFRPHFVGGWSWNERDNDGAPGFVWGVGDASDIDFQVIDPRDFELTFRCRSIRRPGLPGQVLTIEVNGVEVEILEIAPQIKEYRVPVSGDLLERGKNRLRLGYKFHRPPGETGRRALAIAWYELRFGDAPASSAPRLDEGRGALVVPFDSAVHIPVLARPGTVVEIGQVEPLGQGRGALEVQLEIDGAPPRTLAEVDPTEDRPGRWALDVEGPARLSLVAREVGVPRVGGGVAVGRLTLDWPLESQAIEPRVQGPSNEIPPNIVIYLVDTLRADRLGAYGHEGGLSPELDAFAGDGVVFERAIAQSSWTRSAVASLLTGLWPGSHGTTGRRDRLPETAVTLGERLAEAGYETVAVLTNPNVSGNFGFRQGFEHYIHLPKQADSVQVHDRVRGWLDKRDADRPFFLYVHTADPHTPYLPPEPYRSRIAADAEPVRLTIESQRKKQQWDPEAETIRQLFALYDAEIAFNDHSFGAMLDLLKTRELYEGAFVTFLSDHGEEFYEHGAWTHGNNLYNETLGIPWVAKFPEGPRGLRVAGRVQQVDLLPTVLELAGAEVPAGLDGRSLLPLLNAQQQGSLGAWGERPAFAHLKLDGPLYLAVEEADFKLVQRFVNESRIDTGLFDVASDPLEREDLSASLPITTEYLVSRLKAKVRAGNALVAEEAIVDEELARELRALGYIP